MLNLLYFALSLSLSSASAPAGPASTCCASQPSAKVEVAKAETFICPLTGEELPCPECCPANAEASK